MPKVSIVIPVYNASHWLRQSLDSALGQTLRDIEVICVNDGSTDESAAILADYAAKDVRVRVVEQENAGQGAARNRGMEAAKGEFVAFLDADDLYPDGNVLADLVAAAERNGVDVCGGSLEELLPNGAVRSSFDESASGLVFRAEGKIDFRDYAYDYGYYRFIYRLALLRRGKIEFPDYRRFQDPPFMVRALSAAGVFYAIRRATYRYRVELRSVDWRKDGMLRARDLLRGLADVARQAKALDLPRLADVVLRQSCEQFAEVILDDEIAKCCRVEFAELCRAFQVLDVESLLELPYPGRTLPALRRAKLLFRRKFRVLFLVCRFASDVVRYGLSYASGRFRGAAG